MLLKHLLNSRLHLTRKVDHNKHMVFNQETVAVSRCDNINDINFVSSYALPTYM